MNNCSPSWRGHVRMTHYLAMRYCSKSNRHCYQKKQGTPSTHKVLLSGRYCILCKKTPEFYDPRFSEPFTENSLGHLKKMGTNSKNISSDVINDVTAVQKLCCLFSFGISKFHYPGCAPSWGGGCQ